MKHILAVTLISLILAACGEGKKLPTGLRAESFKLSDENQENIMEELNRNNIYFIVDDEGYINYMAHDISKVRKLKRNVIYGGDIDKYDYLSVIFIDPERKDVFIRILEKNNIWYDVSNLGGTINVHYLRQATDRVDEAYQEAYFDFYNRKVN